MLVYQRLTKLKGKVSHPLSWTSPRLQEFSDGLLLPSKKADSAYERTLVESGKTANQKNSQQIQLLSIFPRKDIEAPTKNSFAGQTFWVGLDCPCSIKRRDESGKSFGCLHPNAWLLLNIMTERQWLRFFCLPWDLQNLTPVIQSPPLEGFHS